jgi:hypothetical protein
VASSKRKSAVAGWSCTKCSEFRWPLTRTIPCVVKHCYVISQKKALLCCFIANLSSIPLFVSIFWRMNSDTRMKGWRYSIEEPYDEERIGWRSIKLRYIHYFHFCFFL